jgi:hypothetical protein
MSGIFINSVQKSTENFARIFSELISNINLLLAVKKREQNTKVFMIKPSTIMRHYFLESHHPISGSRQMKDLVLTSSIVAMSTFKD